MFQRGLFHKDRFVPQRPRDTKYSKFLPNASTGLFQRDLLSKLILDSRSSRIDFNLELNNVTNTYKHKCYLHSLVSKVELGNRDQRSLARAVHCSEVE